MPIGLALEGFAERQQPVFGEVRTDELHAHRQVARLSARDGQGRQPREASGER